jgi:hypothetical protein
METAVGQKSLAKARAEQMVLGETAVEQKSLAKAI